MSLDLSLMYHLPSLLSCAEGLAIGISDFMPQEISEEIL